MKDSTRNASALFVFGLFMISISPVFMSLLNYETLFSIMPFLSEFFTAEKLRWGTVSIGFIALILGAWTFLYNWKRK